MSGVPGREEVWRAGTKILKMVMGGATFRGVVCCG